MQLGTLFFVEASGSAGGLTSVAWDWMNIIILSCSESFQLWSLIMWCSTANFGIQNENALMRVLLLWDYSPVSQSVPAPSTYIITYSFFMELRRVWHFHNTCKVKFLTKTTLAKLFLLEKIPKCDAEKQYPTGMQRFFHVCYLHTPIPQECAY